MLCVFHIDRYLLLGTKGESECVIDLGSHGNRSKINGHAGGIASVLASFGVFWSVDIRKKGVAQVDPSLLLHTLVDRGESGGARCQLV